MTATSNVLVNSVVVLITVLLFALPNNSDRHYITTHLCIYCILHSELLLLLLLLL